VFAVERAQGTHRDSYSAKPERKSSWLMLRRTGSAGRGSGGKENCFRNCMLKHSYPAEVNRCRPRRKRNAESNGEGTRRETVQKGASAPALGLEQSTNRATSRKADQNARQGTMSAIAPWKRTPELVEGRTRQRVGAPWATQFLETRGHGRGSWGGSAVSEANGMIFNQD